MEQESITNQLGMQDIIVDLLNSLSALRGLSELDYQSGNEKELIRHALSVLIKNQDMERCSFFYLNEQKYLVNLTGLSTSDSTSESKIDYIPLQFKLGEGIIGLAAKTGEIQNCQNCLEDERFSHDSQQKSLLPGSIISTPVFASDTTLKGVLNISHPDAYHFNDWHIRLLEIYKNMLGQLITNYQLFQEMEQQISLRTGKLEQALTDLEKLKNHFESISMIDQLTGLHNRRYFYEQAEIAVANTKRYKQSLCLLILDLDQFKYVNDNYGHGFGDKVLEKVSKTLRQQVRETDILVRFGGEEFVVIFTNTDCSNGTDFAERIREKVALLMWEEEPGFEQTVSIGLYCLNNKCGSEGVKNTPSIDELVHNADTALYQAKARGRNQVVIYQKQME